MLTSRVPLRHVSAIPAVVQGSTLLVVEWNDGRRSHAVHVHCASEEATPELLAELEAIAAKRDRSRPPLRLA